MKTLTAEQLDEVLAEYDLPDAVSVTVLSEGNNTTYEIGPDPRYVLRAHRPAFRSIQHTRSELIFMQYLHDRLIDVDVPMPVPTKAGELVVPVDGDRHCDLQTWVDGQPPSRNGGLDERAAHCVGHALGRLHEAAVQFQPPADFCLPHWEGDGLFIAEASPFRPLLSLEEILSESDLRDFADIEKRTRDVFAELHAEPGTHGIIHFDYILGNVHLIHRDNDWHAGVIDFDDCGYGYFLYDLGPVLGNLVDHPELRRAVLDGYRLARPFAQQWERHLPVMMAARHAAMCYWTAGLGVSPTPREDAQWRMQLARDALEAP